MVKRIDDPRWVTHDGLEWKSEDAAKKHEMVLWLIDRHWVRHEAPCKPEIIEAIFKLMLKDPSISIAKLEVHRHV
jgi:hypothetical protein